MDKGGSTAQGWRARRRAQTRALIEMLPNRRESATEEEATNAGGVRWERVTRTGTVWGTQESGEGELPGDVMYSGGDTGKVSSVAVDKAGARGCHGVRPGNRRRSRIRRENQAKKSSVVQGNDGCRESSGVAHKSRSGGQGGGP